MPDFLEPFRTWFQDPRGIRKLLIILAWFAGAILSVILGLILTIVLSIMLHPALGMLMGVGWAVSILGLLLVLLSLEGYSIRLLQNVQSGTVHPLPEWEYFWEDAGTGFRYLLALFLWYLPLLLLLASLALAMDLDLSDLIWQMGQTGLPVPGASSELNGNLPGLPGLDIFQMLSSSVGNNRADGLLLGIPALFYMIGMRFLIPGIAVAFSRKDLGNALYLPGILSWTRGHWKPVAVSVLVITVAEWLFSALISALAVLMGSGSPGLTLALGVLLLLLFCSTFPLFLYPYHIYGLIARMDRLGQTDSI